jgi:endoglucanase
MTRGMRMFFTAAVVLCALCGSLFAQTPVARHGKLSVDGNRIVNKDGNPVALRGMSFFWNQWPEGSVYYTAGVTNWLASDWKVDIVRVAVNPGNSGDEANWKTVVDAAIDRGIYVIIDWHVEGQSDESGAKSFFQKRAAAYKNTPNVIFEIWNEPTTQTWSTIRSYATNVVKEIRDAGADNIIIIGSRDYSKRVDEASANPVVGTNLAYSVHYYTAEPGTQHQGDLRAWCNTALGRGLALFVTEFGISEADGGGKNPSKIDTEEANRWFEYLDKNSIGWANWSICNKNEAASALKSSAGSGGNWTANDLSPSGTFIRQKLVDYGSKTVTVTAAVNGQGTVAGAGAHRYGTIVSITANPAAGWEFDGWGGGATGKSNPYSFGPLYENKNVTAQFVVFGMVKNSSFTENIVNWTAGGATASWNSGGWLEAKVTGSTASGRIQQAGLKSVVAKKKYALAFKARTAAGTGKVTPRVTNSNRDRNYMVDTAAVALTTTWQPFTQEFTMCYQTSSGFVTDENATVAFQFSGGGSDWTWYLDDVTLTEIGDGQCQALAALPVAVKAGRASWSVARTAGGALQLRGPAEAGAKVSLYDTRGKMIRSANAADGMTFGVGVPAGNYLVVVKNRAGGEVMKARVSLVK